MDKVFKALLSGRDKDGTIPKHPYSKWTGAHWVLVQLADLDYPKGDKSLLPLKDQIFEWLFSENYNGYVGEIAGKQRAHASIDGNALFASVKLGLKDERIHELAQRLLKWQWPDGGWNCDRNPKAQNCSFHETLIPMRGLNLYAKVHKDKEAKEAVTRAAEIFLKRHLYKKQSDDTLIDSNFTKPHYPPYWHYDILFGLKVMAEAGFIKDKRCRDALDLLESKRLSDGGFPAEGKYYITTNRNSTLVDWGGVNKKKSNTYVTRDAKFVLKEAGRMQQSSQTPLTP